MANPVVISIPEWTWTKIAENVVTGIIDMLDSSMQYYQTYRVTGEAAPTAPSNLVIPTEAVRMFQQSNSEGISAITGIDVYVLALNTDDDAVDVGKIRVSI